MIAGSPRILVVRLSAIGDVVRALPALQVLRERYPRAQIDWVVEAKSAAIPEGHPALDQLIVFDRPPQTWQSSRQFIALCRDIRNKRYDIVVDFHGIMKSGLLAAASRAPERYGFARPRSREGSSLFYTHRVKLPGTRMNRSEENYLLCKAIAPDSIWPSPTMYVPLDAQDTVDDFFESAFDGGKLVVALHAPVDRPEKQWPLRHFAALADLLMADGRFEVMLTWGPGQLSIAHAVLAMTRRNPIIAPETPDLKHYAWLVHKAAVYVGGDTGPMHIAAAMGTPVVAIFGGTDPVQHAPYQLPHAVLYSGAAGPHASVSHSTALARLEAVTPDDAYEACVKLVAPSHAPDTARSA